ncbi:MAG: hypothetical protein WC223_13175 [Bacteroidales bacterium]|jgi:ABC-type xylose transport system substrate-binding protein
MNIIVQDIRGKKMMEVAMTIKKSTLKRFSKDGDEAKHFFREMYYQFFLKEKSERLRKEIAELLAEVKTKGIDLNEKVFNSLLEKQRELFNY